jgi:hypothetical protein
MLTLTFDTRGSDCVYVDPPIPFFKKCIAAVIVILGVIFVPAIIGGSVLLAAAIGNLLGSLISPVVGFILAALLVIVALYYSFISAVLIIALIGSFLRKKVFGTLGYFKNGLYKKDDTRLLECFNINDQLIRTIDLNLYNVLVSTNAGESVQLCVRSKEGEIINLASVFNSPFQTFNPWSTPPGRKGMQTYPADEMFAEFNSIKLVRDGVEIENKGYFTF